MKLLQSERKLVKYKQPKQKPRHNFTKKVGRTSFFSCWHCGLIALNNDVTRRAIQKGCVDDQEEILKRE